MNAKILSIALVVLAACGGSVGPITGPVNNTTTCTYAFSGALTGTFTSANCIGGVAAYNSTQNVGVVSLATVPSNTYPVNGAIEVKSTGGISSRGYSIGDASATGAMIVQSGNSQWEAASANGSSGQIGAMTINVTSSTQYASGGGATGYYIHGTADATLEAVAGSGATGTVTLHAVF